MDSRFAKVHEDPRFIKQKKNANKTTLDDRFAHVLKSEEFGSKAKVDKKGRKVQSSVAADLKRFYKIEEDEKESDSESDSSYQFKDLARGEGVEESSDSDFESESSTLLQELEDDGPWNQEEIPVGEETSRFACVNLDWDHVKAKDLYKIFDGFKPTGGTIKKVSIYPSELGKERLAVEAVKGPPNAIFAKPDEGKDFNMVALRKYQMERLKFYFFKLGITTLLLNVTALKQPEQS